MKLFCIIFSAALSLFLMVGCSSRKSEENRNTATEIPQEIEGSQYVALEFEAGSSELTDINRKQLDQLAIKANRSGRPIDEIKVLAWADKEYPEQGQKAAPADIGLAKERAHEIKNYLKEDLRAKQKIDSFNMAKRPNHFDQVFKNEDWAIKKALEQSGATGSRLPSGSISYTKASKALVIIDYVERKQ